MEHVGLPYRIDTTNVHVDRIPRLLALVQSFLGVFCLFVLLLFEGHMKIDFNGIRFFFVFFHEAADIHTR